MYGAEEEFSSSVEAEVSEQNSCEPKRSQEISGTITPVLYVGGREGVLAIRFPGKTSKGEPNAEAGTGGTMSIAPTSVTLR